MKIEVAESLFLSWLRHIRECRIAQLNWKTSKIWESTHLERVESLFTDCQNYFSKHHALDLFRGNKSVAQLLQQAEIDALGICDLEESPTVIAVDVAFHEGGLNYGPKEKTVSAVLKKIFRTVLILECYFPSFRHEIIFAAPKIHKSINTPLQQAMWTMEEFLEAAELSAECRIITNEDFFTDIVAPVQNVASHVSDTSELFIRSVQLLGMQAKPSLSLNRRGSETEPSEVVEQGEIANLPIGRLVRDKLDQLFAQQVFDSDMLRHLQDVTYSKRVFGLRYPMLVPAAAANRFDDAGRARYYTRVFGGEYYLCNDWYERNRERFLKWCKSETILG